MPIMVGMREENIKSVSRAMGSRLKSARKIRFPRDDQRTFALRVGVSRETMRKMEQGDPSVSFASYLQAADILGCLGDFDTLYVLPKSLFEENDW